MGARRGVDGGENGDDGGSIRDAETDRGGGSVNGLSGIDRRGLFRRKGFIDGSHLVN